MPPLFNNVGIIGLGLIGSSLARAIKQKSLAKQVYGYAKSQNTLERALELGVIDYITNSVSETLSNCDIIIICTPLSIYESIFIEIAKDKNLGNNIITDVGSLKEMVIKNAEKYLPENILPFVIPAHPIAGTEKTGVESGFAELFTGRRVVITPLQNSNKAALEKVETLWKECGSNITTLDAATHDKIYAKISHLPQLLAYAYKNTLQKVSGINTKEINNQNFQQFTRLCASDPFIWADIFSMNHKNIIEAFDIFKENLIRISTNKDCTDLTTEATENLPTAISTALKKTGADIIEYAGSGFRDMTSYATSTHRPIELSQKLLEIFLGEIMLSLS